MQLAINIGISACLFALAAAGIGLTQATIRQIPFMFAATMSVVAYVCHGLYGFGCPFPLAILLSVSFGGLVACTLDFSLLRPLDKSVQSAWKAIAISLGAYVVIQAALAVIFGEAGRTFSIGHESHAIGNGWVTQLQLVIAGTSIGIIGALLVFLRFGRFGRAIRGLASNPDLCALFGIRTSLVRAVAVGVGGGLTGLAAVFTSGDSGLISSTGFSLFAAAFIVLVGFLIWKPLGFSGRRLRKVEV